MDASLLNMLSFKKPLVVAIKPTPTDNFHTSHAIFSHKTVITTWAARFRIISRPWPVQVSLPCRSSYVYHCRESRHARHNFHTKLRAKESLQTLQGKGSSSSLSLIMGKKLQETSLAEIEPCFLFPITNQQLPAWSASLVAVSWYRNSCVQG